MTSEGNDETVQFDKSLKSIEIMFKYSGLNLKNNMKTPNDVLKHRLLFIVNFTWLFIASIVSVYFIIIGKDEGKDFLEVTSVAPCLIFSFISMTKSFFHTKYEADAQELVNLIRALEVKHSVEEKCVEKEEIANTEIEFLSKVIKVLYVLSVSMMIVFDVMPLLLIGIKYYKKKEFDMLLPFLDIFTLVPNKFVYWVLAYILEIWAEAIALLYMGAADYLFYTCCTHIRVQFRLLQYDFERIIPSSFSKNDVHERKKFHDSFNELVRWHHDLIHCVEILELIYSKSTLSNFLSSSLVLCLTGFNVTSVTDVVVIITYLTFLSMALMQIFFLCLFADMLSSASMEISDAMYRSRWYLANTAVANQMLIVQTRAQKPCKLTAAGFADVNLNAFMRVLSTAWSYLALLQTVYAK